MVSHRATQIPSYLDLGRHHFPDAAIDLIYLTPPMVYGLVPSLAGTRFAHVGWPEVAPLLREVWSTPTAPGQRAVVDGLLTAIDRMERERPAEFLASLRDGPPPVPEQPVDLLTAALELAAATAQDGQQRALDHEVAGLHDLLELRLEVRDQLAASPAGSSLRTVVPWIWNAETTDGQPLTGAG